MSIGENPFAARTLAGGRLCLDFTNTISQHAPEPEGDWLHDYADLVWWVLRAGVLDEAAAEKLFNRAGGEPARAAEVFARAIEFREALFRVLSSSDDAREMSADDLAVVNRELSAALVHLRVRPEGEGFAWGWDDGGLDRVLWPVVRDAAELLVSEDLARVGGCAGERCDWLYLDTSRNRSRRWCTMADCGNRAKARRHYHRHRETAEPSS
ncbi:MAG TPA: ABATE domain-containing protein [Longimicrobium sp.]|jgi:predicted RNA-binding Zn ribbon-like protein